MSEDYIEIFGGTGETSEFIENYKKRDIILLALFLAGEIKIEPAPHCILVLPPPPM